MTALAPCWVGNNDFDSKSSKVEIKIASLSKKKTLSPERRRRRINYSVGCRPAVAHKQPQPNSLFTSNISGKNSGSNAGTRLLILKMQAKQNCEDSLC